VLVASRCDTRGASAETRHARPSGHIVDLLCPRSLLWEASPTPTTRTTATRCVLADRIAVGDRSHRLLEQSLVDQARVVDCRGE